MADINKKVVIKILGDDKGFKKSMKVLPSLAKAAAVAATTAFAGVTAATIKSINAFKDFEDGFSTVKTLLDEGSFSTKTFSQGVRGLQKDLIALRASSGESFDNLNKGLFDLISAGVDAEKAIESLDAATKLATAGATNTATAVDGMTSAMNAFEGRAGDATAISEKFFTAQKFGKTTIAELSSGIGQVASIANNMGVSFEQVLAATSAATLGAIETNQAYTGLNAIFANIIRPTKEASKEASRLGIEFSSTALKSKGLSKFLMDITQSSKFSSTSLEKLFSSTEATKVIMSLAGAQSEDFAKILAEVNDETKRAVTFQDALSERTNTLKHRFGLVIGKIETLFVRIGEKLAPKIIELTDEFQKWLDTVSEDDLQQIADGFAAIVDVIVEAVAGIKDLIVWFGKLNAAKPTPVDDILNDVRKQSEEGPIKTGGGSATKGDSSKKDPPPPPEPPSEEDIIASATRRLEAGLPVTDEELELLLAKRQEQDETITDEQNSLDDDLFDMLLNTGNQRLEEIERQNKSEIDSFRARNDALKKYATDGYAALLNIAVSKGGKIAKAAQTIQAAMALRDTYFNAIKAYQSQFLPVPTPSSPARGVVAAAAATTFGLAQVAGIKGAAQGTIVGGTDTGRDNRMMAVRSGEMILPPDLAVKAAPTIRDIVRNEDEVGVSGSSGGVVRVEFAGDAARLLREVTREGNYAEGIA